MSTWPCFLFKFLSGLPQAGFGLVDTESGLVGSVLLLSPGLPAVEKKSTPLLWHIYAKSHNSFLTVVG